MDNREAFEAAIKISVTAGEAGYQLRRNTNYKDVWVYSCVRTQHAFEGFCLALASQEQQKPAIAVELEIDLAILKLENAKLKKHISNLQKGLPINPYFVNSTINEKPLDTRLGVP
jgi:hypothetical protein